MTHKYTECVQKSKGERHWEMNTLTHTMIFFMLILNRNRIENRVDGTKPRNNTTDESRSHFALE